MLGVFLVVLVIMLAMNGFIFAALRNLADRVGGQINQEAARQLTVYDEILDRKSGELHSLQEKVYMAAAQLAEAGTGAPPPCRDQPRREPLISSTVSAYRPQNFCNDYRQIKTRFQVNLPEAIDALHPESNSDTYVLLQQLNDLLSFNVRYSMLGYSSDFQLSQLEAILPPQAMAVINRYLEEHDRFDILNFCDWLGAALGEQDNRVRVYTAQAQPPEPNSSLPIEFREDADICEGFRLLYKGKLYDYSIQKRELI